MTVKLPHWLQLALGLASIIIVWLMDKQAAGALTLPASVMTALLIAKTIVGLLSPSVEDKTNQQAAAEVIASKSMRPPPMASGGLALLLVIGVCAHSVACTLFAKAAPTGAALVECVIGDAVKGDTLSQIAVDCSADIPAVIQALVSSSDPRVTSSHAMTEARRAGAALHEGAAQ